MVVNDKAAVDVRSEVGSCFRCEALAGVAAGGIVRIYERGLLRCRPYDQGNARSLKQWDGDKDRSRAFLLLTGYRQGGETAA